jgi:sodium bicarbonate transporter 10
VSDEAIKDQGALNSHPSYTDTDFEGHRAHSFYTGLIGTGHRRHGHHRRHRHHHRHHHGKDGKDDNRPATPPSQRVQFILGETEEGDDMRETHPLFSEMEELFMDGGDIEWRETARWIKFEEVVEEGGNRWSKPHVATLSLHSLFELRCCLLNGAVMLDMDATSLEQVSDLILDNLVNHKQLLEEHKDKMKDILLRRHRHLHEKRHGENNKGSRIPLIRSLADIGRVHSSSKSMQDGSQNTPVQPTSPNNLNEPPHFGRFLTPGKNKARIDFL